MFGKKWFYRFNRIFEPQKHDCNDKTYFSCLEETSPYPKPFPRKILYLKMLTHITYNNETHNQLIQLIQLITQLITLLTLTNMCKRLKLFDVFLYMLGTTY